MQSASYAVREEGHCWLSTACLLTHIIAIAWDVILLPGVYLQLPILTLIAYIRHQHSLAT
jgi:hypothetical protein